MKVGAILETTEHFSCIGIPSEKINLTTVESNVIHVPALVLHIPE